ncbi:hypothetical protein [Ensifer adhaerens]|uniref:hypothetical protein n=1 Tax=Ensifer adhaerens TaxID=106592 RepID=UPI000CF08F8F|nr:hypothetical protein [Ensifer adhaerens]
MSSSIQDHMKKFPHCRPSTLAHLQKREETHAKLRAEIGMDQVSDRRSRFVQSTEPQEGVLQRLLRVFVRK